MKTPSDSTSRPCSPHPRSGLVSMQRILLKTFFSRLQRDGVNTRPLTRQLSMLFEHASVALGLQAMLNDTLSRRPTTSTIRNAQIQLSLLQESLRDLESTLTELSSAVPTQNGGRR